MPQNGLSKEELLAKCDTSEPIMRQDMGMDSRQATNSTVYLKENKDYYGTKSWNFSQDSNNKNDN